MGLPIETTLSRGNGVEYYGKVTEKVLKLHQWKCVGTLFYILSGMVPCKTAQVQLRGSETF